MGQRVKGLGKDGRSLSRQPKTRFPKKKKQKSGIYNKLGNRMITQFLNWVTTNLGDSSVCPNGQCPSLRSSKLTDILVPASLLYSSQPRPAVANYSDIPLR